MKKRIIIFKRTQIWNLPPSVQFDLPRAVNSSDQIVRQVSDQIEHERISSIFSSIHVLFLEDNKRS